MKNVIYHEVFKLLCMSQNNKKAAGKCTPNNILMTEVYTHFIFLFLFFNKAFNE